MGRLLLALSLLGSGLLSAGEPPPLQTWWTDLGGDDAKKAYQAIWRFVEHPQAAVAFLEKNLQPAVAPDPKRVQQLLHDLESERFQVRDRAAKELEKLGSLVEEALVEASKRKLPLEAQRRVNAILDKIHGLVTSSDQLRAIRGVETLEMIRTAEAKRLLQRLSQGAAAGTVTRQAKMALGRLEKSIAEPSAPITKGIHKDMDGLPLPPGAVARLGTTRYRFPTAHHFSQQVLLAPDGITVLCWGNFGSGAIRLYDVKTGKEMGQLQTRNRSGPGCLAFSPDGKWLAVPGQINQVSTVVFFDWESRKERFAIELQESGSTAAITFLGNKELALVDLHDKGKSSVRIINVERKAEIRRVPCPIKADGRWQFSPNGKVLAASGDYSKPGLYLWEWQTDKPFRRIHNLEGRANGLAFSPDARTLAFGCDRDGVAVRLFDVASGKLIRRLASEEGSQSVSDVAFTSDGKSVAATPFGTGVVLWDLATGKVQRILRHLNYWSGRLVLSRDDRWVVVGDENAIRVWDMSTGKLADGDAGHAKSMREIAFSPKNDLIATAGSDGTIRLWAPDTGTLRHTLRHERDWTGAIAFSPDGRYMASSGSRDSVCIWETATGKQIHRLVGHRDLMVGGPGAVRFSSDSRRLASWGYNFFLRVFDVTTGKCLREHRPNADGLVLDLDEEKDGLAKLRSPDGGLDARAAFLPDSSRLLMASQQGAIAFFDVMTGTETSRLEPIGVRVSEIVPSPDQQWLLIQYPDPWSSRKVLDARSGRIRFEFSGTSTDPAWSWDSRTIGVAEQDKIVLREMATGQVRLTISLTNNKVTCLGFSPDGRLVVAGLDDTTAMVWDLATLALTLPAHKK